MSALTIDPPGLTVPASGGTFSHTLTNSGGSKIVFKVKSSNNNEYRIKPVFGFVDAGASSVIEVTRTAGAPKDDKLVIQYGDAPADAATPQDAAKSLGAAPPGTITVPMSAT